MSTPAAADPFEMARSVAHVSFAAAIDRGETQERAVDAALDAYGTVLAASGYMALPADVPSQEELAEAAKWLAGMSGFPRYADGDGWKILLEYPDEVTIAYAKAITATPIADHETMRDLHITRRMLFDHALHTSKGR